MKHPFEAAGLGKAPFRCVGVSEKVFIVPGMPAKAGGTCQYCFNGIRYAYHVRGSDGAEFHVGCDCIAKVDMDLNKQAKRARRDYIAGERETAKRISRAERRAKIRATRREVLAPHFDLIRACFAERHALAHIAASLKLALRFGTMPDWKIASLKEDLAFLAAKRAEEARRKASQHIGKEGERMEATLTCVAVISSGDRWNPWTLKIFHDEHGNTVSTFGKCDVTKHETALCRFTVKKHQIRNGEKQTMIIRIKEIKKIEEAA